jgi:hypothetical protein
MSETVIIESIQKYGGKYLTSGDNVKYTVDPFMNKKQVSYNQAVAKFDRETTITGATLGKVSKVVIPQADFISESALELDLGAATGATNQINTLQFSGGTAVDGEWFVYIREDNVQNSDEDFNEAVNWSKPLNQATTAALLQTELLSMPLVQEYGNLTVVLTSGTIAGADALFTITWTQDGNKPQIYGLSASLSETTSGIDAQIASVISVAGLGYVRNCAMNSVNNLKIYCGGETLAEYDSAQYLAFLIKQMDNEQRGNLYEMAGGKSFESGRVYIPLPQPWSNFGSKKGESEWFPYSSYKACKLEYSIRLNSAASLCNAGASGVLQSASIIIRTGKGEKSPNISEKYPIIDINTVVEQKVSTGVKTKYDIKSFQGTLSKIGIALRLVSDVDVAHNMYNFQNFTRLEMRINNRELLLIATEENRRKYLTNLWDGVQHNEKYSGPFIYTFQLDENNIKLFSGGLSMSHVDSFEISVTHEAGADCYLDIVSQGYAYLEHVNEGRINLERF